MIKTSPGGEGGGGRETQSDKEGHQLGRVEISVYINLAGLLQKAGNAKADLRVQKLRPS